jgi:DNA-binding response OmpR family regulator
LQASRPPEYGLAIFFLQYTFLSAEFVAHWRGIGALPIIAKVPVTHARPRVLVVEDDAPLAHLYCTALALRGIACSRAADGVAALRSIEQHRPTLILLDLMLPVMNGWTVLRELSENPLTSDIPIVVVTGVEPTPHLPHALTVLCKPCDPDHVADIVTNHLTANAS